MKAGSIFSWYMTEIWSGSSAKESMRSGVKTHENEASNIETDESTVAEDELS